MKSASSALLSGSAREERVGQSSWVRNSGRDSGVEALNLAS